MAAERAQVGRTGKGSQSRGLWKWAPLSQGDRMPGGQARVREERSSELSSLGDGSGTLTARLSPTIGWGCSQVPYFACMSSS